MTKKRILEIMKLVTELIDDNECISYDTLTDEIFNQLIDNEIDSNEIQVIFEFIISIRHNLRCTE